MKKLRKEKEVGIEAIPPGFNLSSTYEPQ